MSGGFEGRRIRAAVLREINQPLEIEELEIAEPGPGEVMVKMAASGTCHSDLHVINGEWASVVRPIVLGHEGAGIVEKVGPGVERVQPGNHVVLSWMPGCGHCRECLVGRPHLCISALDTIHENLMPDGTSRLRAGDEPVRSMIAVGSLGEYAVVPEIGAIPIDDSIPLDLAAVVGCAVATGVGAAVNTARVEAGQSVVVIGCGGVGISVIQGCAAASAGPLIAVDANPEKLSLAASLGATHTVDASKCDAVQEVFKVAPGGVDFAFEAIGLKVTIEQAAAMLAPRGAAVLVGMPPDGVKAEIDPMAVAGSEHRILGCNYGSCNPPVDFPRFLALYKSGHLDLEAMVTRRISLDQVNEAFEAMAAAEGIRTVVVYD